MSIYIDEPVAVGQWSLEANYGTADSVSVQHHVKISKSVLAAEALVYAIWHPSLPHFPDAISPNIHLYVVSQTANYVNTITAPDDAYLISVTTKAIQSAKMENGYLIYFRSNCQQTTAKQDVMGQLTTVGYTYPGDTTQTNQVCDVPWFKPGFELVATGISEVDSPIPIIETWLNKVNATSFWGVGSSKLLCTAVTVEPLCLTSNPKKYKFSFSFSGVYDTHFPTGYFIDPQTGKTPTDIQSLVGIKQFLMYDSIDYSNTFPFGGVG